MEIAEKDVAVAPDLDDLLGLLSELFYPQDEGLNKAMRSTMRSSLRLCLYLNKSHKNPGQVSQDES